MPASFVHLRLHTEYSLVDGLVRIKPLVKTLVGMNMPAVAVTDQNNMCSLVKFYKNAMGAGIKPICGADLWLSNKDPDNPLSRISLLAMNGVGYRNLTELFPVALSTASAPARSSSSVSGWPKPARA